MKVVVDRIVQYPNRFQLVNVDTSEVLGVFDLSAVTGTVQQVGTEIDAELFQSIQDDLTQLAQNIVEESNARGVDVSALQDSIATKITANGGELGNAVVSFTEISNATNIASGEKASILFGKIRNWFSRLKALAFKDTITDSDISSSANISQSKVSGLTAMQSKLNGIDVGANKYTLPIATATALGGVKVGSRLSVATDGTISADVQSDTNFTQNEKSKLNGIESGANNYILPNATANTLGGVKVGDRLSIVDGVLSANLQSDNNFTQAEKTKLSVLSKPNLLINSNFAINQRGAPSYTTNGKYTVDRWLLAYGTLTVNSNGSVTHTASNTWQGIRQMIENPSRLAGKTVTLSARGHSTTSTRYIIINLLRKGETQPTQLASKDTGMSETPTTVSVTTTLPTDITDEDQVWVGLITYAASKNATWYWAKLELDSVATAYTPPIYSEELLKCQALDTDAVQLLRSTDISTTYPLSSSAASDSKVLSEKVVYDAIENVGTEDNPVPKATNATNDSDGNPINTTYAKNEVVENIGNEDSPVAYSTHCKNAKFQDKFYQTVTHNGNSNYIKQNDGSFFTAGTYELIMLIDNYWTSILFTIPLVLNVLNVGYRINIPNSYKYIVLNDDYTLMLYQTVTGGTDTPLTWNSRPYCRKISE